MIFNKIINESVRDMLQNAQTFIYNQPQRQSIATMPYIDRPRIPNQICSTKENDLLHITKLLQLRADLN